MSMEATMDKLCEMRMTTMSKAYREQREDNGFAEMGFDERFSMIVEAEWDTRRVNKRTRLLRAAKFAEPEANVMDVCYDVDRKLDKSTIMGLSNCEWIRNKRNVVLTGASGAGKTWIACALGVAACNAFYSVRYVRLPEMVDELVGERSELWLKAKKKYIKADVLIVDDWLLEQANAKETREILEIVESRQRTGSLLLCSQYGPNGWHAKLGDGAIADAVVDRIVYNSHMIHIEGNESMRKRMSALH
jgi:DNA replication protein DnaC